jgi:heme-degrading monooxygenase HmoA
MIGRLWRGWTAPENADAYVQHLTDTVLPGIHGVQGHRGAYLLRRDADDSVEFVTLTLWESLDAIREFAGDDVEAAVVPPRAQELLSDYDRRSTHYEIVVAPD